MEYKFEVIVAVGGMLPAVKKILDEVNNTMKSFTGSPSGLTARGNLGSITLSSSRVLIPTEVELFRVMAENLFAQKYPEWKAEVKYAGEI